MGTNLRTGMAGMAAIASATAMVIAAAPAVLAESAESAGSAAPAKPFDFNGDGYRDIAMGSPYGTANSKKGAGFVSVVYGSSGGPNTSKKQVISQSSRGVPGASETADHWGYALDSIDIDRDGYADLIVGAPDEDIPAGKNAGAEWIFWGSRSGLMTTNSLSFHEPENKGPNRRYGSVITTGDYDGDGWTDYAAAAPGGWSWYWFSLKPEDARSATNANRLFKRFPHVGRDKKGVTPNASLPGADVMYMASGDVNNDGFDDVALGWRDADATDPRDEKGFALWLGSPDAMTMSAAVYTFPGSLAIDDFDGDGFADLVVGKWYNSDRPGWAGGHIQVFNGDADGSLSTSYDRGQDTPGVPGTGETGDQWGYSLATGDVNGDGIADLAVGAPREAIGTRSQAGMASVLLGGADGLTGTGAKSVHQNTSGVPGKSEKGDWFGWKVTLLDVNRDGKADLTAGAPHENSKDGAVSFLKGTASNVTGSGSKTFGAGTIGVKNRNAQIGVRLGRA